MREDPAPLSSVVPDGSGGSGAGQGYDSQAATFIGRGELAFRLPGALTLTASADRSRYLWTLASAHEWVMMESLEARLGRPEAPGWAGEAVVRLQSFEDDNRVNTAYAWVLAPVVESRVRLGYSFSWADAQESRWFRVSGWDPSSSVTPTMDRYDPYFTPNDEVVHRILAEVSGRAGRLALKLDGNVGVWAREQAPVIVTTGLEPEPLPDDPAEVGTRYFYEREFTPWRIGLTADFPVCDALSFSGGVEAWETAYYEVKQFALGMVYRYGAGEAP
jgi:hypothetical protein